MGTSLSQCTAEAELKARQHQVAGGEIRKMLSLRPKLKETGYCNYLKKGFKAAMKKLKEITNSLETSEK